MKVRLSPLAARRDLTDRECVEILGGLIASLCNRCDPPTVQRAVKWWGEHATAWTELTAALAPHVTPAASTSSSCRICGREIKSPPLKHKK